MNWFKKKKIDTPQDTEIIPEPVINPIEERDIKEKIILNDIILWILTTTTPSDWKEVSVPSCKGFINTHLIPKRPDKIFYPFGKVYILRSHNKYKFWGSPNRKCMKREDYVSYTIYLQDNNDDLLIRSLYKSDPDMGPIHDFLKNVSNIIHEEQNDAYFSAERKKEELRQLALDKIISDIEGGSINLEERDGC